MDYRLESEIWRGAQRSLAKDAFIALLAEAFAPISVPQVTFNLIGFML